MRYADSHLAKWAQHKWPAPERTYRSQRRRCLRCREAFTSTWPGHRICDRCKQSEAWRTAESAP
jgi:hypothetical protein